MGAFVYADDCLLISPTVMSMSCLLKICDDYRKEFNVHFNLDKYQLLHCTKSANHLSSINYNGIEIKASKKVLSGLVVSKFGI